MDNKKVKQIANQLSKCFNKWDYNKAIEFSTDETQTRDFLIEPFFDILKYNKMDDYLHEYIADMGGKRGRRVDMAIGFNKNVPIINTYITILIKISSFKIKWSEGATIRRAWGLISAIL